MAGPSSTTLKKVAAPPAVNVWSLRKEQMVKAQSQQLPRGSDLSAQAPTSNASAPNSTPLPPLSSDPTLTSTTVETTDSESIGNAGNETTPDLACVDPAVPVEEDEDPWIVRPYLAPAAVRLPALDATSWPEVGKAPSVATPPPAQTGNGGSEREEKGGREQGGGQRRGE